MNHISMTTMITILTHRLLLQTKIRRIKRNLQSLKRMKVKRMGSVKSGGERLKIKTEVLPKCTCNADWHFCVLPHIQIRSNLFI